MRLLALMAICALLAGCADDAAPAEEGSVLVPKKSEPTATSAPQNATGELAFTTVEQGVKSGVVRDGLHIETVQDESAWEAFWAEHDPESEAPPVDFEDDFVVLVFMGKQDSTGHRIEVTSVRATDDAVLVDTRGVSPQDACVIGPATQPHHFVAVPRAGVRPDDVRGGAAVWEKAPCEA